MVWEHKRHTRVASLSLLGLAMAVGLLALGAVAWSACLYCTSLGCQHGIIVGVRNVGNVEFTPGDYQVVFERVGGPQWEMSCTISSFDTGPPCVAGDVDEVYLTIDQDRTLLRAILMFRDEPELEATYRLVIVRDSVTVVDHIIEAPFHRTYPNGEQCGPVCWLAEETASATPL